MPSHIVAPCSTSATKAITDISRHTMNAANGISNQQMTSSSSNVISYSIVQNTGTSYDEMTVIGNGAYGTVYKARDLAHNGKFVALKKVRIPLGEDGVPISTIREIALLKQLTALEHPNIVRLLDICHGKKNENERQMPIYLVFEHVDQDLSTYLKCCPPPGLCPEKIKDLTYQLLSGLDFLHFNRVLHRDLKPQNILISSQGVLKLADFGLARIYSHHIALTSVVVTLWYRPPEVLLSQAYATAVDVWSAGCILAELYRRTPLFPGVSDIDQLAKIFEVIGSPSQSEWPESISLPWSSFKAYKGLSIQDVVPGICSDGSDLLKLMLCFNPAERISCSAAMKHPYFRDNTVVPTIISRNVYNHKSKTFRI